VRIAVARVASAGLFGLCALSGPARSEIIEDVASVPVTVRDTYGDEVSRDVVVTVLHDPANGRAPLLVLSHGRGDDRTTMGRSRFPLVAGVFVERGYTVVVPTRIGYGATGGPDVESVRLGCDRVQFGPGFRVAADETQQVIDWAARRDDVDASRIVAVGVSYGGATSVALAARNPPGLVAVVNFSGGSGGDKDRHPEQPCRPERLATAYATYGRTTHVPELWLYAENDRLWGADIPKTWFARYREAGAPARFVAEPPVGDNGHALMQRGIALWRDEVARFLDDPAGDAAR
jgi:dienelactone hydrolase